MAKYLLLPLTLFVTACATSQPAPTQTSIPPTPTSIPPTRSPQTIEVTFDGKGCTVSGPTEVPAGESSFILENLSDVYPEFYVSSLLDDHTYQDLLDRQGEPGRFVSKPDWAIHARRQLRPRPDDLADNEYLSVFSLEEGDNVIYIGTSYPAGLWFCAPLEVTDALSE